MRFTSLFMVFASVAAQQAGKLQEEKHPQLTVKECTNSGGCQEQQMSVTIDSNWRWTHKVGDYTNCYTGNTWDQSICPDAETCTQNCAVEGADEQYTNTYGVHTSGNELKLNFVTQGPYSKNIGSRVYLMESDTQYKMFHLNNREFTFTVDDSKLPCGLNGAFYMVQMDQDGGMAKNPTNKAGAKYGTGYCDAQCPHDMKFINGEANVIDWKPSPTDPNAGTGKYGTCCTEMDIWEGNSISSAYTPHACDTEGAYRCSGTECGDNGEDRFKGVCDKNGCDFQTWRLGNKTFYGPGSQFAVDTTQPVQVVTQWITADGTDSGNLTEIRRFFVQNGNKIELPKLKVGDKGPFNSVSNDFCKAEVELFADNTNFLEKGGFTRMQKANDAGMVLAMSLWDDHYAHMLWLDSKFPTDQTGPGTDRGSCATTSGDPKDVESQHGDAYVVYSDIRYGELGSTTQ